MATAEERKATIERAAAQVDAGNGFMRPAASYGGNQGSSKSAPASQAPKKAQG